MKYEVHIRCVESGEVRVYVSDLDHPQGWLSDGQEYMWTEGNWSCDCNRELFFRDWDVDDERLTCGETKYRIAKVVSGGREFFPEDPA